MSNQTIEQNFVIDWTRIVHYLGQQKMSRLRNAIRVDTGVVGNEKEYPIMGMSETTRKTTRHADTQLTPADHSRRLAVLHAETWADLVDWEDDLSTLIDPSNAYTQTGAMAMGRAIDRIIIEALGGAARTSSKNTNTTSLPTAQTIVHGGVGLTKDKLLETATKLNAAEIYSDTDKWYMAISAEQLQNLLNVTEITSADYNSVKALVQGNVDTFMGFKFIKTQLLPKNMTTRDCFAFTESSIQLAIGKDMMGKMTERPDKNYSTQIYYCIFMGAVRLEEKRVVKVECTET